MRHSLWLIATFVILLAGCSSSVTLGIVTKSSAEPGSLLKSGRTFQELGPVEDKLAATSFLRSFPGERAISPMPCIRLWGKKGGDALLNVSVETSLYGFIPIYNVYSFTCTTVKGIAIKFE